MNTNRLEAFSDGVIAIIITIMVLEMKVPHGAEISNLMPVFPIFISYVFSFIYIGIYWNNHHHLWHVVKSVNGKILWANLHLLFWLSLFPFVTGWMGANNFEKIPVALYGFVLFMASIAWLILNHFVVSSEGQNSKLAKVNQHNIKGKVSVYVYGFTVILSFYFPIVGAAIYALVAVWWFIPNKMIEKELLNQ